MIRLVIADDHQIVIDGLVQLLSDQNTIEIVGTATDGGQLIARVLATKPDIALIDIDMPVLNGIDACSRITNELPETKVVALTMLSEMSIIRKMLEAGASGYLMKNTGVTELLQCLQMVHGGGTYYGAEVADRILNEPQEKPDTRGNIPRLSRRELQILQLVADEFTTQEIAEKLDIAFGTVETHRRNIMQKLGSKNVVGMIRTAIAHGFVR